MKFRAGGVRFEVGPEAALMPCEREAVARLDPDDGAPGQPGTQIELCEAPPWSSEDPSLYPQWEPAVLRWTGDRLLSSHRSFTAELDPFAGRARLARNETRAYPLETVVRTSLMARLPLLGGLPFHAAGIAVDGRGLVFFGPSGAGKTTIASTSPFPVLSDELVAVTAGAPFSLERSGFWGEAPAGPAAAPVPLATLFELAKGERFALTLLRPAEAAGRILGSVPVPAAPPLWSAALAVVKRLVEALPVYRLEWTPADPPWDRLARLASAAPGRGAQR